MLYSKRLAQSSSPHEHLPVIVIVEDNPADVRLFRLALDEQREPYTLEVLSDGEEALRFIEDYTQGSDEPRPCIVVLDLHLPKYDGASVLRAIRSSPALTHIHVVVLTTSASPAEELEVRCMGVRLYKNKPSGLSEFMSLGAEIIQICKERSTKTAA